MKRRLRVCALALVSAVSVAACGGTGVSDGKKAADKARRPAAEAYWKLYASLAGAVSREDATGEFPACGKNHKDSVSYKITYIFWATSKTQPQAQLTATVLQRLSGAGWRLQPDTEHVYKATHGDVTVGLREIVISSDSAKPADAIYVQTACVDVGKAMEPVSRTLDTYKAGDAGTAPVPTGFPTRNP